MEEAERKQRKEIKEAALSLVLRGGARAASAATAGHSKGATRRTLRI